MSDSPSTSPTARIGVITFPGTLDDVDAARAVRLAGAEPVSLWHKDADLRGVDAVVVPGGFSYGDYLRCGAIARFAPVMGEVVSAAERGMPVLGICNGFQALVKLGLVPYGDIVPMTDECATLTFNAIGRHQSRLINTRIASNLSPWFSACELGDILSIAISHGEGRFVAPRPLLERLRDTGQIATQYVDASGQPSLDLSVNPNGSMLAIEGITSPDGRILGKMGHSERSTKGTFKNVCGRHFQPIFEGGVSYFA